MPAKQKSTINLNNKGTKSNTGINRGEKGKAGSLKGQKRNPVRTSGAFDGKTIPMGDAAIEDATKTASRVAMSGQPTQPGQTLPTTQAGQAPVAAVGGAHPSGGVGVGGGSSGGSAGVKSKSRGKVFAANASAHGMTEDQWARHLDDMLGTKVLAVDPSTGKSSMSNDEFNREIGDQLVKNLESQRASGEIQGGLQQIEKKGRGFVVGDVHNNIQNLAAILHRIQSDPSTNLDNNPDNKIIFLGDTISPSKEGPANAIDSSGAPLHGEAMQRFITWLRVRYPNQVLMINGNHDMFYYAGARERIAGSPIPNLHPVAEMQTMLWGMQEVNGLNNDAHHHARLGLTPIMIRVGDASKGEKVRIFQHAPGDDNSPTPDEVAKMQDPEARVNEGLGTYNGHGAINQQGFLDRNKRFGSNQIYFGHLVASSMRDKVKSGGIAKTDKTDQSDGAIGELEGGGVFVDSQLHDDRSGFIEINFDDDTAPEKVHRMTDVLSGYTPTQAENDMRAMAKAKK
jgi:hypothetical protein